MRRPFFTQKLERCVRRRTRAAFDAVALEGNLSIEQSTRCTVAGQTPCLPANSQSITKFGLAGFSIVTGTGADQKRYLDVSGALVMLPDLDGSGGPGVKGIECVPLIWWPAAAGVGSPAPAGGA